MKDSSLKFKLLEAIKKYDQVSCDVLVGIAKANGYNENNCHARLRELRKRNLIDRVWNEKGNAIVAYSYIPQKVERKKPETVNVNQPKLL